MSEVYDLVVIGGGPGGYVCAIRAAQLGMKVACVEKRGALGGTCLNVGCIPSKALLHATHMYEHAAHHMGDLGVAVSGVRLDLPKMMAHKDKVVSDNTGGIEFLFKKNKITYIKGAGKITAPGTVQVSGAQAQTVQAKNIVIATGSDVMPLPGVTIDEKRIVSSTGGLSLSSVPGKMVVIGAGVIGLELGSVWRRLGAEVTVVEYLDFILPPMDGEIRKQAQRILEKQGMDFRLGYKVTGASTGKKGVSLKLEPSKGGAGETLDADVVLVAIGRRPYTEGLGLESIGVVPDSRGFIAVDHDYQTKAQGVFAIGDVIGGQMLAHKAEEEGVAVAELLAGQSGHVNYGAIPSVVYTDPEIAMVGKTEEQLKADGVAYKVGKFPFTANGRARANNTTDGLVKVLADAKTDRVLGCHIVGAMAGDLIQEVVVGMEFGASAEDIARSSHAHPQLGEAIKEAMLAVDKRPLHI
ncbi:dihydrolipoyl dehydrogenase [Haematospirillum sp. 15-248]|uniref:dihydrolipoyl dehydrogenase n=1 Tax=Haematospirillum sp. 15-248 TaxID=2723107 RepID=UPI00143A41D7|nr:dihydrolipoyl dehydrogenase [Haematospirillum sp. 15-248]NKD88341.1 dihydrolipoyl dehydrogenase [Haematospirillum sp. 15-248]